MKALTKPTSYFQLHFATHLAISYHMISPFFGIYTANLSFEAAFKLQVKKIKRIQVVQCFIFFFFFDIGSSSSALRLLVLSAIQIYFQRTQI